MTQIFISRAELLPEGETLEDHKIWQHEEADIVEKDKKSTGRGGGLFGGRFRHSLRHSAIRDDEDGVDRCPLCAWELSGDGYCTSCGFETDNAYPLSGSISDLTDDEDGLFSTSEMGLHTLQVTMSALEESANRELYPFGNAPHRVPSRMSNDMEIRSRALRPHLLDQVELDTLDDYPPRSGIPSRFTRSYFTNLTDDELGDIDDYSSEEDDPGSLRNFIMEEGETEDGHPTQLSPRSSHYDSDEASGIFEALGSYSSDESDVRAENGGSHRSETPEARVNRSNIISVEDDDSDEGPILRSRVRAYRRSLASPETNRSEEASAVPAARPQNTRRQQQNAREGHYLTLPANASLFHEENSLINVSPAIDVSAPSIETESDSDLSVLVRCPRIRPRRAAPNSIISDDDERATISSGNSPAPSRQSSSGTRTIGRQSPVRPVSRNQVDLATAREPIAGNLDSPGSKDLIHG